MRKLTGLISKFKWKFALTKTYEKNNKSTPVNNLFSILKFTLPMYAAAAAKSLQSCLTLCDPIDGSPPGFPVPGILQARTLEWVAISFSSAWKWKVKVKLLSPAQLLATPWTAAYQAPLSMGFSRQEYWSGLPLPSPLSMYICIKFSTYKLYNLNIYTYTYFIFMYIFLIYIISLYI